MSYYKLGDFLNDINNKKENLLRIDDQAYKDYNPFIINRCLSYHVDCIMRVNELNNLSNMNKQMSHDYLINSIRKKKRYAKFPKKMKNENLELIKEYYQYNDVKALEALQILTDDDIIEIKNNMNKGGR